MADLKNYTIALSGYGFGGATRTSAGDTDGKGSMQTVMGTSKGEMVVLDSHAMRFSLRDISKIGNAVTSLDVVSPKGAEPNGIITGVTNYALLYEWTDEGYSKKGQTYNLGGEILDLNSSDLNHDGKIEVVVTSEKGGVQVYSKESSSLNRIWRREPRSVTRAALGDTNGDGADEMVLIDVTERLPFNVSVLRARTRDFVVEVEDNLTQRISGPILAADIDDDSRAEIILAGPRQRRFFVFRVVNRRLVRIFVSSPVPQRIVSFAAGDIDGDGRTELVVATASEVFIFRWNGRTFVLVQRIDVTREIVVVIVRDINFDGIAEIIIGTVNGRFFILRPRPAARTQFLVREEIRIPRNLPDARKVIRCEVDRVVITEVERFSTGVFIRGFFDVQVTFSARRDGRVFSFSRRVPFSTTVRTPVIFGNIFTRNVEVEVEFVDCRFDPDDPREITVIIVARVILFNFVIPRRISVTELSQQVKIPRELLIEINELDLNEPLSQGELVLVPEQS